MSNIPLITLTDAAKKAMITMLEEAKGNVLGIRLGLATKGCSGLSWMLEITREDNNLDDKININDKYTLFIDKKAALFILGTKMDYVETELESGFVFDNPKERGKCGCGESFYI